MYDFVYCEQDVIVILCTFILYIRVWNNIEINLIEWNLKNKSKFTGERWSMGWSKQLERQIVARWGYKKFNFWQLAFLLYFNGTVIPNPRCRFVVFITKDLALPKVHSAGIFDCRYPIYGETRPVYIGSLQQRQR